MSNYYVKTKGLLGICCTFRNVKKVHENNFVGFIKQDNSGKEYWYSSDEIVIIRKVI